MSDELVFAYRRDNGEAVRIPADWLEHPILGIPYSATPPLDGAPIEERTVPALRELAADRGIDLTGLTRKADLVAAITATVAGQTPAADTTTPTDPPATPVVDTPKEA